jgi:hypothetical protein
VPPSAHHAGCSCAAALGSAPVQGMEHRPRSQQTCRQVCHQAQPAGHLSCCAVLILMRSECRCTAMSRGNVWQVLDLNECGLQQQASTRGLLLRRSYLMYLATTCGSLVAPHAVDLSMHVCR